MPAPEGLLHEWLLRTAAARPAATAIIEEERTTSFGELVQQAQALAARLADLGVRQGDRVALVLPKTTGAIVAVFAALMAGAAYVPLHPRWPKERIDETLEDCGAKVVIDADAPRRLEAREQQSNAAVILFTSGSTGRPKGVVLSHRAVGAFVNWCAEEFRISAEDRVASPSPLGFDLSTFDIFTMALRGATCVIVPENVVWMPRFLVQFIRESRITCWYSVPSVLAGMLDDGGFDAHSNPNLRLVLFAGEVFGSAGVARLQRAVPHALCANLYGPTETNVVTWYRVRPGWDPAHPLPIGRACPYACVRMDDATGELLVGGESLMGEYWNRPDETARAIVEIEGRKYYRTGDRVTIGAAGDYTFVGRLDRQVKRRGFRIELGEIEAALARHEAILEVAAVAGYDRHNATVITAFVRARPAAQLSLIEAKQHCARVLPPYMAPDRILFREQIPKGNRGKVDYAALKRIAEEQDGD